MRMARELLSSQRKRQRRPDRRAVGQRRLRRPTRSARMPPLIRVSMVVV